MEKHEKIFIAGHSGFVGNAIMKRLREEGYWNIIFKDRKELDLTDSCAVHKFYENERPDYVFLAAAKVGGIKANINNPVEFLNENLKIQLNVLEASFKINVKKLMFLGSSCIYPKNAKQPLREEYLLTGELEPTNDGYALAKIVGLKCCQYYKKQYGANYTSVMPSNLYGPGDNFDLESSHVLAALIRRIYEAKITNKDCVDIWGSGNQFREFTYIEDVADAIVYIMKTYDGEEHINIGTGKDVTIKELAELIKEIVGYQGNFYFDTSKPDGMYRKVLDVTKLKNLGWSHKTDLKKGIEKTYHWYLEGLK